MPSKPQHKIYKETDMYEPIRALLQAEGFTVRGEVKSCDVAAVRGDDLWVVEMKLSLSLKLLYQAVDRQVATGYVFVALPKPKKRDKNFNQFAKLLKKLKLGLMVVSMAEQTADIVFYPDGKANKANVKTRRIKKELEGRRFDTKGGAQTNQNTAYRERSTNVLCLVETYGPITAARLRKTFDAPQDTYNILSNNYNQWFEKIDKGVYALSEHGRAYLHEHQEDRLVQYHREKILSHNVLD